MAAETNNQRNVAEMAERDEFVRRVIAAFRIGADGQAPLSEQYRRTAAGIDAIRKTVRPETFRLRRRQAAELVAAMITAHDNLKRHFSSEEGKRLLFRGFECCGYLAMYWGAGQPARDLRGDFYEDACCYAFVLCNTLLSSATIVAVRSRDEGRQALGRQTFEALCQGLTAKEG